MPSPRLSLRRCLCRLQIGLSAVVLCCVGTQLVAQEPSITATSPNAVMPGQTVVVRLTGKNLAKAKSLWSSFGATATLVAGSVKDNEAVFSVNVPAATTPGIYGVRVATDQGVSGLRLFVVDDMPSVNSAKARTLDTAQLVNLPTAIDGITDAASLSVFKFHVSAGQRVSFEVLARRLGSALDPLIRILDLNGREITYSDDALGLSGDARLVHTFATAGDYYVELRDIRYTGGAGHFYRLRIGDFPLVCVPYPLAIKKGVPGRVEFVGADVGSTPAVEVSQPAEPNAGWINVAAKREGGQSSAFSVLAIGATDEVSETEPNNVTAAANRLIPGQSMNGRLHQSGDVDRFVFAATKGQTWLFRSFTRRLGSPADLMLSLYKTDGGRVVQGDDTGAEDVILKYKFPTDGDYVLEVRDLHHRGGPQFAYRVETALSEPGFTLSVSADRINIPVGGTAAVTVAVVRNGFGGPIALSLVGQPGGVEAIPTVIGPGMNHVALTMQAADKVATGKVYPVRIVGQGQNGDTILSAQATLTTALQAAANKMPSPPQVLENEVAVGIAPKPPFVLSISQPQVEFARKLNASFKVSVARQSGFDEAIVLAVTPAKGGLPGGITAAVKPIAKGTNEVDVTFSANEKAALGEFTAALTATHKKGKQTVVQAVPGIMLKISEPFQLSIDDFKHSIPSNGELSLNVRLTRNPAFKSPVKLTVEGLPQGVTAVAVEIPADKSEGKLTLIAKEAKPVAVEKLVIVGVGSKLSVKAVAGPLNVEQE